MKTLQKHILIQLLILSIFIFGGCNELPTAPLIDQIYIQFKTINFGGNWDHYKSVGVDNLRVNLDTNIFAVPSESIKLNEKIEYMVNSSDGYDPYLPQLDTKSYYIFKPSEPEPCLRRIDTEFWIPSGAHPVSSLSAPADYMQKLNHGTVNDISLSYSMDSQPQVHFSVKIVSGKAIVASDLNRLYNFDVAWKRVHISNYPLEKSINLAIMADGFRADQMHIFRSYVEHAFAKPDNIHYTERGVASAPHVPNDFFTKYWDWINVYMFETASPHAGIDKEEGRNDVMNFFQLNMAAPEKSNFFRYNNNFQKAGNFQRMKYVIDATYYKTGLDRKYIDAYIILVNDPDIWAYTYSYGNEINYKNEQPVHAVIIQAPVDYTGSYHVYVITDAIAHELGHAMARLQDEYEKESDKRHSYSDKYRNISDTGYPKLKWQRLITLNFGYYNPVNNPVPYDYNDQKLVNLRFPTFKYWFGLVEKKYYIPTVNSTMRGENGSSINFQFGPVNTYHMEGSFKTRIGDLVPQDPKFDGINNYEWRGYPFEEFIKDWPPSDFN